MGKKILVIGAGGFIGHYLMQHLTRAPERWLPVSGRSHGLNLTEPSTIGRAIDVIKPDAVINLAAIATLAVTNREQIFAVNAFGVLNLLEVLSERNFTGRIITASSAYVYGAAKFEREITEDTPFRPHNLYANAKVLAEGFCDMYRDKLNIVISRPFNAIGCGHRDEFLVPKIVRHFRERAPEIELGNINVARDYTDVRDLARMYELLLGAECVPEALHFCSGKAVSIAELLVTLQRLTGHNIKVRVNQSFIRKNDATYQCGSTSKLQKLGFEWQYSLEQTMQWMLQA